MALHYVIYGCIAALRNITLQCNVVRYISLKYSTLLYVTLHYFALPYMTWLRKRAGGASGRPCDGLAQGADVRRERQATTPGDETPADRRQRTRETSDGSPERCLRRLTLSRSRLAARETTVTDTDPASCHRLHRLHDRHP